MTKTLTKAEANKTLRATPEKHRSLKILAAKNNMDLIEVTNRALALGIHALQSTADQSASSN